MSAIVAAAGDPLSQETRRWVVEATKYSRKAGPDGEGLHVEDEFGLGVAVLRTSPEELPLRKGGGAWMVADARLDGRAGLATRLGLSPASGDTEVLLGAYSRWKDSFLDMVAGDFALAVWGGDRRLRCARDQLGVAPLHYARVGTELLVASSIEALLLHPKVPDDLDEAAVAEYLVQDWPTDANATSFRAIRRVPPAHELVWERGAVRLRKYWQPERWEPLLLLSRTEEYAERFRELLDAAVADRITGDRVAVQLSGGMDSTSIAASALATLRARGAGREALRAVTALLASDDREGAFARLVAERLQIQVDVIVGGAMPAQSPEEPPSLVTPEPTPYRPTPFQYELARVSAGHSPTTLTGVAGDALLLSGPWYWAEWVREGQFARLAKAWWTQYRLEGRPHPHLRAGLHNLRRQPPPPLPGWLAPDLRTRANETPDFPGGRDARTIAGDLRWSVLFLRGDPTFTGLPIRFRYPLVDLRLLRFVLALPPEPWLVNKRILREATASRLPPAVRARPKTPLGRGQPGWEDAGQLASFVRTVPGLDRFICPDDFAETLRTRRAPSDYREASRVERAVGLAHWMAHWRSPRRQDSADTRW